MRALLAASLLLLLPSLVSSPAFAEDIGSVNYRFKWLGPLSLIHI